MLGPSKTATVQAGPTGPGFELATQGLAPWRGNCETPESAVGALSAEDVGNLGQRVRSDMPRVPGSALVIGPIAHDADGRPHVLTFSRFATGATRKHPTRLVLTPVPVAADWTAETWRQAMIDEAKRWEPAHGVVHFWQVKQVERFEALANTLLQTFGRDGQGWAQALDYVVENGLPLDPTTEN
jgi:hypothetical protein